MARVLPALFAAATATLAYGSLIERNAFTVRRFTVPVLPPGAKPIRLLHISDLHLTPQQRRKQAWIRRLADFDADIVINTGDTLSAARGIPAVMGALEPLLEIPGAFVPGNNDYYAPRPKNPLRYFASDRIQVHGPALPWPQLAAAMERGGWLDLTHKRASIDAAGVRIAVAGTDDPHLGRARYELIAGLADPSAIVRIGVMHSPEPALLAAFAADRYDLVLAGHTHGGQVRIPFGPAIVTNSGIDIHRARWLHPWDEHMYFHVCAGLGTSPWQPVRIACRPEASLLTLVSRA